MSDRPRMSDRPVAGGAELSGGVRPGPVSEALSGPVSGPASSRYWWPEGPADVSYGSWPSPPGAQAPGYPQAQPAYVRQVQPLRGAPAMAPEAPGGTNGEAPGRLRRAWRRVGATIAAVGAFLAKFGVLLLKLKYIGLVLSMLVSVVAYSLFFGWTFAVGFVLLIFVHEMGHVIVLRRQGVKASAPLFIPFLGAFVNMREMPKSAYHEAISGLAGPYFGTAGSVVVAFWGHAAGSNFLLQLAAVGFMLNLFNLLPVLPLDGGRAAAALHPALWIVGLAGLVVFEIYFPSPVAVIILLLGGLELWRRFTRRKSPSSIAYHALASRQRLIIASMYMLVVAVTLAGFQMTYVGRGL